MTVGVQVCVVITGGRLLPLRRRTVGISIGFSGFVVDDDRRHENPFGNGLKVTRSAVADDFQSAAELLMGESEKGVPVVIAQDTGISPSDMNGFDVSVTVDECIFVRGVSNFRGRP